MEETKRIIELSKYKPEHLDVLLEFQLPEEQAQFTALPSGIIKKANEDPSKHLLVILAGDIPVGFFVLNEGNRVMDYTENIHALLLSAFSINFSEQGKGYAKKGLRLLPAFVSEHFKGINEVLLAVNKKNTAAQIAYKKSGFIDRGQRRMGPKGEQLIFQLPLI
ncbi:GNAT family N-acetyltransferase [Peribacillus glennii]|uniref:GNAT family N-acetyltransferase n=1 Tax=Peribacillus glennii TaxID=2303991 RepID=A0A372L906_9BACI|nr:GNAT family N-acetyltransferase [Peribacillus glennii]RFU62004.1 GNAT family N-acetyltransferase [Peribacillus glennii]